MIFNLNEKQINIIKNGLIAAMKTADDLKDIKFADALENVVSDIDNQIDFKLDIITNTSIISFAITQLLQKTYPDINNTADTSIKIISLINNYLKCNQ